MTLTSILYQSCWGNAVLEQQATAHEFWVARLQEERLPHPSNLTKYSHWYHKLCFAECRLYLKQLNDVKKTKEWTPQVNFFNFLWLFSARHTIVWRIVDFRLQNYDWQTKFIVLDKMLKTLRSLVDFVEKIILRQKIWSNFEQKIATKLPPGIFLTERFTLEFFQARGLFTCTFQQVRLHNTLTNCQSH